MRKLIFFATMPISGVITKKWDIDVLARDGLAVEYWDLSTLCMSEKALSAYFHATPSGYADFDAPVRKIEKYSELSALISQEKSNACFFSLSWEFHGIPRKDALVYAIFSLSKADICIRQFDLREPVTKTQEFKYWIKIIYANLVYRLLSLRAVFYCGTLAGAMATKIGGSASHFSVKSPRIDWGAIESKREKQVDYSMVYIDEALNAAPDAKSNRRQILQCPGLFEKQLSNLFEFIESLGLGAVVVAGSPKIDVRYDKLAGRSVIFDQTLKMVSNASFVLGHESSALDQAAASGATVVCLTNSSNFDSQKNVYIRQVANSLNLPISDISDLDRVGNILKNRSEELSKSSNEIISKYFTSDGNAPYFHQALCEFINSYD